jgi:hypothetical protein
MTDRDITQGIWEYLRDEGFEVYRRAQLFGRGHNFPNHLDTPAKHGCVEMRFRGDKAILEYNQQYQAWPDEVPRVELTLSDPEFFDKLKTVLRNVETWG